MTDRPHPTPGRDHVSQIYLGLIDPGPTGDWLRRRIDWMAAEARGPRVLDVGCSEGILEVLLARRGIEVTGVDIDPDALHFARELVANEPDEVGERVELIQGDFAATRLTSGPFDTVVMGELLGCVDDPGAMLDSGLEYLRPGGRVVVTAPLGVHPSEEQRQTFFLTDVIDLFKPRLGLEHLGVEDDHIHFVGRLSEDREASWRNMDAEAVLSMIEEALVDSQTDLYGILERQGERIERLQQRLRERVGSDQTVARRLQRKVNHNHARLKLLDYRYKLDRLAMADLKKRVSDRTRELNATESKLLATRRRLDTTLSSTSFLVGSALIGVAKRPLTLWKLPLKLLRIYRSKSRPRAEAAVAEGSTADHVRDLEEADHVPEEIYPNPSQFIDFPPLSLPSPRTDGPTVAAILDTFTEYALQYEANLLLMSPIHWRAQLEGRHPVCLFVESAWRGNNGGWRKRIVGYEDTEDNPLRDLLRYCRSAGIPTVFWNKEDPPHFGNFIGAAREFDFVFTSDSDCVPRYKEALGHDRVYALPFAAQPRVHNPSREKGWPKHPVCFAGSWVSRRYPERAERLRYLLEPAVEHGLHIFDRNLSRIEFGLDYRFPDRYNEAIKGTLTYEEMLTAYRCYDVMLNVNTISESPTMFARRVFESLASGTPVISSESVAMSRMLGGRVRVSRSMEDTQGHLEDLLEDEEARVREGHLAYRHVHENHTYRLRMNEVFRRIGVEPLDTGQPSVSVVTPTMRPENVAHCLETFRKQTYENKELVLILNNAEFDVGAIRKDVASIPNVQMLHVEGRTTLGDCLNRGVEAASGSYVAKMDDDDYYGERYISDSVLAASFSDAEIVGKGVYFVYFDATDTTALRENTPEHMFTSSTVAGGTLFTQKDVAGEFPFASLSMSEDTNFLRSAERAGCRVYSSDRFNYMRVRMGQVSRHSWKISDAEFRENCRDHTPGLDLSRAMI